MVVCVLAVVLASRLQREHAPIAALDRQRRGLLTLLEHEVPGPLRELATELRGLCGVSWSDSERLVKREDQLGFLSDDLASLGELEVGGLRLAKRSTNIVDLIHELRAGAMDRKHVVLTVPVAPVRIHVDPDRLRQALDAMFREVSATADTVSVDCPADRTSVSTSIGTPTITMPSSPPPPLPIDHPSPCDPPHP